MSTHTPGPWYVANGPNYHIRSKEHGQVFPSGADGRLMAAAPDLLAALKEIQAMAESRSTVIRMQNGMQLGNFCRAAIAKAEEK